MPVKISQLPAGAALTGVEEVPIVQSSTTVRVLMSAIGAYVRGLFTATPLTIAEGGTGAATAVLARAALGAAASGANSDITSLSGLTTALSIAQGGTGQKTQADALTALLGSSQIPLANGGTGAATAALARIALGAISGIQIKLQVFTASGTYTPTSGMLYAIVKAVGGGGAGGGSSASFYGGGGGGGAGETAEKVLSASDIGTSQTVTIGAGGVAVTAGAGGTGGNTSLGTLVIAKGGVGGSNGNTSATAAPGGTSLTGGTGDVVIQGGAGGIGIGATSNVCRGGEGGSSTMGEGAPSIYAATIITSSVGNSGVGYGSGGSGAVQVNSGSTFAGGDGKAGILLVAEFIAAS